MPLLTHMPNSIQSILKIAQQQLIQVGQVDSPKLDAELLLANTLKQSRTYLITWPEKILSKSQILEFDKSLQLRLTGQPIAYILGHHEFWGLKFEVTADTLIPRPETETLIEVALALKQQSSNVNQIWSILELGTGSGAIALSLKSELPNSKITALDCSHKALSVAQHNAQKLQLEVNFLQSDWFSAIKMAQTFDCIISNPPYIESADPHVQKGDLRFEPITALTSGEDGLDDIRIITDQAWLYLKPNAWLMIEYGYNQAQVVNHIFTAKGYQNTSLHKDLAGTPRIIIGQK